MGHCKFSQNSVELVLKGQSTMKHIIYAYIKINVTCLEVQVLICGLVLYFHSPCEKLVTKGTMVLQCGV